MEADISELDEDAVKLRTLWDKMINYADSFSREFAALEERFQTGRYGSEWTFSRWLMVKCGLSRSVCYRVIHDLRKLATEDEKRRVREAIQQERARKAQAITDRKATQIAWNAWLLEEKQRKAAVQAAWDAWRAEEKWHLKEERKKLTTERTQARKRDARNAAQRKRRRLQKAQKATQNNKIDVKPISSFENLNDRPTSGTTIDWVNRLDSSINELVLALHHVPLSERFYVVQNIVSRLWAITREEAA